MKATIKIQVVNEDATKFGVDVLVLKYAQDYYGLEKYICDILIANGLKETELRPKLGGHRLVNSVIELSAKKILLIGVKTLYDFRYQEIREFSRRALSALASTTFDISSIAFTMHGANYGLDEYEAFKSELAGLIDAIHSLDFPPKLENIFILEINKGRFLRLTKLLKELIPNGVISTDYQPFAQSKIKETLETAGVTSANKEHIFVAMPFKNDMDDTYYYGIESPIRAAGFLCERADLSSFVGDVMLWVRERIKTSKLVVAELTDANPNVYLEVGYAWGCGVPTILLVKNTDCLKFDVRGQRCLSYSRIKDLEELLKNEIENLKSNQII